MQTSTPIKQTIQKYLDERAATDKLFALSYSKKNKNIDECCNYILGEAMKKGMAVFMSDDEVYSMAVHYYDEDNIKINKLPANCTASVGKPVELTEEDKKKANEAAIKRLAEEQHALLRKKTTKKKVNNDVQQMTLFWYATEN